MKRRGSTACEHVETTAWMVSQLQSSQTLAELLVKKVSSPLLFKHFTQVPRPLLCVRVHSWMNAWNVCARDGVELIHVPLPCFCSKTSVLHTCGGHTENNTPVNVFIWLHSPSTASFYLTIIIPQPASIPRQQHLHSISIKRPSINITSSVRKISAFELITTAKLFVFWFIIPAYARFPHILMLLEIANKIEFIAA